MNNKRRSIIWKVSDEELTKLVKDSSTLGEILNHFGLVNKGNNSLTLKQRLKESEIEYAYPLGLDSNKGRKFPNAQKIPLQEILVENSTYSRTHLKKRLINEKLIEEICNDCGLKSVWNEKKLMLVLDHVNGISNDNRLENLQLLCPNCNSQTSTFAGRNKKYKVPENAYSVKIERVRYKRVFYCKDCGDLRSKNSKNELCFKCFSLNQRKVERPEKETLLQQISELGYTGTGKLYGVSDNAVRKWLK